MTYLYETIPVRKSEKVKQYEIQQGMNDSPLAKHPETGEPIRRIILGGWGVVKGKAAGGASSGSCGCGPGQSCG